MKVALCVIATGKYTRFLCELLGSAREFFCPGHEVQIHAFTDCSLFSLPVRYWPAKHEPWPGPTLHRYRTLFQASAELRACDYVYYVDVDSRFVRPVGEEIFGDLVATIHWGYVDKPKNSWTFETRPQSRAFVSWIDARHYFCGGFQGGAAHRWIRAMEEMDAAIRDDEQRGITAVWHDESHWNRYLVDHPPTLELGPEYTSPENYYLKTQRIVIVSKDIQEVRS
jgi:histo-blood group ABO system transferase